MVGASHGPLAGVRIVELGSMGAMPFAGMLLADLGCDVIRIRRATADGSAIAPALYRGRSEVALDLTNVAQREQALAIIALADGVMEGYKTGVAEQAGVGPQHCLAVNPRLAYGRVSGWGLDGPLASAAGNDINHLALSGALHAIGPAAAPAVPLNLLGEYAGGALFLALGMVAAILRSQATGEGQVVDVSQTDGVTSMMTLYYALHGAGRWADSRSANLVDGAAPFYRCYACADGRHVAVGALEPLSYVALCQGLGIAPAAFNQYGRERWGEMADAFSAAFAARTRDEWAAQFDGTEACVTPVLSLAEAPSHPHHKARESFTTAFGSAAPSPTPRFSGTPSEAVPAQAETVEQILARWE